jgi:hypothetical protein
VGSESVRAGQFATPRTGVSSLSQEAMCTCRRPRAPAQATTVVGFNGILRSARPRMVLARECSIACHRPDGQPVASAGARTEAQRSEHGPQPAPSAARRLDGLPVGLREEGEVYRLPLLGNHLLLVGETGSGKSSAEWWIVDGDLIAPRAVISYRARIPPASNAQAPHSPSADRGRLPRG